MAKGYLVAHIRVDDAEAFQQFGPMSGAAIQEHGGRVLVRSPSGEVQEGSMKPLTIVVEFDDLETARRTPDFVDKRRDSDPGPRSTGSRALRPPARVDRLRTS